MRRVAEGLLIRGPRGMGDRHQIKDDAEFWTRLEYYASHQLQVGADKALRQFWFDGFDPLTVKDTKRGVDVEGMAWVGHGSEMDQYCFVVSVPQKMLHGHRQNFSIAQILLDDAQHTVQIVITLEKQVP